MKHIIGLMRPDSGSITIDDEDVTKFDDRRLLGVRRKFGMVFQQAALFDSMSVWDNVAFPLKEHTDLPHEEINRRVLDKLDLVALLYTVDKFPLSYPAACASGLTRKSADLRPSMRSL